MWTQIQQYYSSSGQTPHCLLLSSLSYERFVNFFIQDQFIPVIPIEYETLANHISGIRSSQRLNKLPKKSHLVISGLILAWLNLRVGPAKKNPYGLE